MHESLLQLTHLPGIDRLVAGAVVHSNEGVLIVRRSLADDFLPGIEELPSGGCNRRESVGEALDRELQEEIGWRGPVVVDDGFATHFDYVTKSGALVVPSRARTRPEGTEISRVGPLAHRAAGA